MVFCWILQYLNNFGTIDLLRFNKDCVIRFKVLLIQMHGPRELFNIGIFVHFK